MKRILLNSSLAVCLLTALVSIWVVANPVRALAASSSATCANGQAVECHAAASQCFSMDSNEAGPGYCFCISNSSPSTTTAEKYCTDSDEEPYLD